LRIGSHAGGGGRREAAARRRIERKTEAAEGTVSQGDTKTRSTHEAVTPIGSAASRSDAHGRAGSSAMIATFIEAFIADDPTRPCFGRLRRPTAEPRYDASVAHRDFVALW